MCLENALRKDASSSSSSSYTARSTKFNMYKAIKMIPAVVGFIFIVMMWVNFAQAALVVTPNPVYGDDAFDLSGTGDAANVYTPDPSTGFYGTPDNCLSSARGDFTGGTVNDWYTG